MKSLRWVLSFVSASFLAVTASAQQGTSVTPAGPGTIVGIVLDQSGAILDSADVYIVELKRRTQAGADGRFRFDSIAPGKYTVAARHVGFLPSADEVTLGQQGVAVVIRLSPIGRRLPTVVTSAARGGLSGVVSDSAFNVIRGARLQVVASSRRAVSDSAGSFYIDVPTGKHMLSIRKDGYETKLVSVTVPPDSGRQILVSMAGSTAGSGGREEMALDELRVRLMRRNVVYSNLMTREDINRSGFKDLSELARVGATRMVRDDCPAIVDGGPGTMPLWSLLAADIEMLEVYHGRPQRNTVTSIGRGGGAGPRRAAPAQDCEQVYVWLRK